jgi:hypothetical protein
MTVKRRELVAGAIIVGMVVCLLLQNLILMRKYGSDLPLIALSDTMSKAIPWLVTIYALGSVVFGAWLLLHSDPGLEKYHRRSLIRAVIPGFFIFALVPAVAGLLLFGFTGIATWSYFISCLSFPAIFVYLLLALWKRKYLSKLYSEDGVDHEA